METFQNWQVNNLRISILNTPINMDRVTLGDITGLTPETKIEQTQLNSFQETSSWNEHQITLTQRPTRVDLVYSCVLKSPTLPNGGEYNNTLQSFIRLIRNPEKINGKRIALGASVMYQLDSEASAYKFLKQLLPNINFFPEDEDFIYQINRPRTSKVEPELTLNLINKWSVIKWQISDIAETNQVNLYAVHLELDLNTAINTEVPSSSHMRIINELAEISLEFFKPYQPE